ncbi:hypothetical protein GLYMA_16G023850v4 [Glycine max]|nr:hypothetical protein GLYMA_16G023850v4 [Glycine max]KAG4379653.1 hypothetical protein GLYMA_16G023850v4 [Glycine max]
MRSFIYPLSSWLLLTPFSCLGGAGRVLVDMVVGVSAWQQRARIMLKVLAGVGS